METLLIRLQPAVPEQAERDTEWLVFEAGTPPLGQGERGLLKDIAELTRARRVVVLVPAEDTLLATIQMKTRNRQQLVKAIPFALEEELAEDVANLHFALGERMGEDEYPVCAVANTRIDSWTEELAAVGITPHALMPELQALPLADQGWSLLLEDQRALVRTGICAGFAVEPDNLSGLIGHALEEFETLPESINIYRGDQNPDTRLPFTPPVEWNEAHTSPMELFATGLDDKRAINLLQGDYAIKDKTGSLLRPWRAAAALLVAWIVIQLITGLMDYQQMSAEERALRMDIERVFKESFPKTTRVVNPRVQMEQRLQALEKALNSEDRSDFLALLMAGGQAVNTSQGVRIDTLNYRNGRLEVSLMAADLQSLDRIKLQLQKGGFVAEIDSAETVGQRVEARLRIQGNKG